MSNSPTSPDLDALLKHGRWVRALARSLVADADTAEDVEQKTWLAALERPPDKATNPRAWLGAVVRNFAGMHWREQKARRRREAMVGEDRLVRASRSASQAQPDSAVSRLETVRKIATALSELAEPYGTTLYLRFFEELTIREIAKRLGIPQSTAHARIQRGLEMLRVELASSLGNEWRNRCLVFTVPFTKAASGGLITVFTMTLKTKILVGAASVALLSVLALQPWESVEDGKEVVDAPSADLHLQGEPVTVAATEELPDIERRPLDINAHTMGADAAAPGSTFVIQVRDAETLEAGANAEVLFLEITDAVVSEWRKIPDGKYMDPEQLLESFGVKYKADENGILRLPLPQGRVNVAARIGNYFGYHDFNPEDSEEDHVAEILLREVKNQRVIVRDESGQPVPGVSVGFSPQEPKDAGSPTVEALTNEEGVAELRHLELYLNRSRTGFSTIGLPIPCKTPQFLVLSKQEIGAKDIYFTMPATGEVQVECRAEDGSVLENGLHVELQADVEMAPFWPSMAYGSQFAEVKNGVATFPQVGVGAKLIASTFYKTSSRHITAQGIGPLHQGDVARFPLVLPTSTPLIRIHFVGPSDGSRADIPKRMDAVLHYRKPEPDYFGDFLQAYPSFTPNAKGWIEISADAARQAGAPRLRALIHPRFSTLNRATGRSSFAFLDLNLAAHAQSPEPIELKLGESTVVAGVVVDSSGTPVAEEKIGLGFKYVGGPKDFAGYMSSQLELKTDENGRFRFAGPVDQNLYSYTLNFERHKVPFELGQEDLRLQKLGEEKIWGRLLVDNPAWIRELELHAVLKSESDSEGEDLAEVRMESSNGRYRMKNLPTSNVELQVRQFSGFVLARLPLDDLTLEETDDGKRVPDWDLRGKLFRHVLHLEVDDPTTPIYFIELTSEFGVVHCNWIPGKPIVLFAPKQEISLEFYAEPYRTQNFLSNGKTTIHLSKGLALRLVLPEHVTLPQGSSWYLAMKRPQDLERKPFRISAGAFSDTPSVNCEVFLPTSGTWLVSIVPVLNASIGADSSRVVFDNGTTSFAIQVEDSLEEQVFTIPASTKGFENSLQKMAK